MAPAIRILLRYGVGAIVSLEVGEALASDPDVIDTATIAATTIVGVLTEWWYRRAKKKGGDV